MDTFNSVQWQSEDEDTDNSRPTTANTDDNDPSRLFQVDPNGPPQAGTNADAVDLAGVGSGTMVTSVSDPQTENELTKDAFVSYLVTTDVRETHTHTLTHSLVLPLASEFEFGSWRRRR